MSCTIFAAIGMLSDLINYEFSKEDRKIALEYGLAAAEKKDSNNNESAN